VSEPRKSRAGLRYIAEAILGCTKFWQAPVDELHSTENKGDVIATILLTLEMEGVKTHSFFDKFSS
jgi:hypothetical protein